MDNMAAAPKIKQSGENSYHAHAIMPPWVCIFITSFDDYKEKLMKIIYSYVIFQSGLKSRSVIMAWIQQILRWISLHFFVGVL